MTFEEATREAALAAQKAVTKATERLRWGRHIHEDDLTGILVGRLDAALEGEIGGLKWDCTILRHRSGKAAEEQKYGADLLIHVKMDTPTQVYSKGALIQMIKVGPDSIMWPPDQKKLIEQCHKMLNITAAAFVMDYGKGYVRCGAARVGSDCFAIWRSSSASATVAFVA